MLSCVDVADRITSYMEGELGAGARIAFEEHVVICPPCRARLTQLRATRTALGGVPSEPLPPGLEARLLEAFRGWSRQP